MSSVNANFSINNVPQVERFHNETIKAPAVNQIQAEQMHQNETLLNLKKPIGIQNEKNVINESNNKKTEKRKKGKQHKKNKQTQMQNNRERKIDKGSENGFLVDLEG
jgi:hypothetical protein